MQSYGQQAASRRPNALFARAPELLRTYHPLAKLVIVGLLAIGVSGALCGLIAWGFGRDAVAGDTLSANLSAARCAQLIQDHTGFIWDLPTGAPYVESDECRQAELKDHTDEVVGFRLFAIPLALIAAAGYDLSRRNWFPDAKESDAMRRLEFAVGFAAFGLAALVLLAIAFHNAALNDDTEGLGRWLADGFVAAAFCLIYGVLALRQLRRPSAP